MSDTGHHRLAARQRHNHLYDWVVVHRAIRGHLPNRPLCETAALTDRGSSAA